MFKVRNLKQNVSHNLIPPYFDLYILLSLTLTLLIPVQYQIYI
jgi:hypothetical protein